MSITVPDVAKTAIPATHNRHYRKFDYENVASRRDIKTPSMLNYGNVAWRQEMTERQA